MDTAGAVTREPVRRGWIAACCWGVALAVLLVRAGLHPARPTSLTTYLLGGEAWRECRPIYTNWRGFVYPPVAAWFFALLGRLPLGLAAVLWRGLTAGVFLAGVRAVLPLFPRVTPRWAVWIALLPLAIGNIDNAQANPLIAGLLMLAAGWTVGGSWWAAALAIGLATEIKVYPVALALLLCVAQPRRLPWRIALVLAALSLLPFAGKDPAYVAGQYHAWLAGRLGDDRFHYPMKDAPLDLWYLLVRLCVLPLPVRAYEALQAAPAAALAVLAWRNRADPRRCVASSFLFGSAWMLLLGPATENQTYVVLAPAAALAACEARPRNALAIAALAGLVAAAARNSLLPHVKGPWAMALQPLAALLLFAALVVREAEAEQKTRS